MAFYTEDLRNERLRIVCRGGYDVHGDNFFSIKLKYI